MKKYILWSIILVFVVLQISNLAMDCKADAKKVLLVVASKDFRDEEFQYPYEALRDEGFGVVIASSVLGSATGMLGMSIDIHMLLTSASAQDYDAIIFIGGLGAQEFWDDVTAHTLVRDMHREEKLVSAICIAPVILANAGILDGKKATVWRSESHKLEFEGATYTGKSVEVDGNIITADGPSSAQEFAEKIVNKLKE